MSTEWRQTTAGEVKVGDRVKAPTGEELSVSSIEFPFLGRPEMLALIEDSAERWYKRPLPVDAPVEVQVSAS
jgi:hypothetical protein